MRCALLVFALNSLVTWATPEKAHKTQRKSPSSQETIAAGDVGQLPRQVEAALQNAKVPREALHVMVIDPQATATPRLSHQAQTSVNPASLMKLVTTTAAFDVLGPSFVWRTPVYVDGAVRDGVLQGNVYLRGSGDPRLNVERLWLMLRRLQGLGIQKIQGDIVLDRSAFDIPARDVASFDGEPLRPYNVAPQGLLLNFNALLFKFTPNPTRGEVQIDSEPPLRNLQWSTTAPLSQAPCQDWRTQLKADFSNPDFVRFNGTYPLACGEQKWPVAYVQPQSFAPRMVHAMWQLAGGKLSGQVRDGITPARATLWHEAASLPLSEIVADINKFSNNVMAQQLFLSLSSQHRPGQFETSRAMVLQWWRQNFKDQALPVLENGSGLSREERSNAQALGALLQSGLHSAYASALQNSLAIAGVDGTVVRLKDRLPQSVAIGRARLKSGSLRDVASLAGYVEGLSGQRYVFVVIVNHPNANAARPALDKLLEWVVKDDKKS